MSEVKRFVIEVTGDNMYREVPIRDGCYVDYRDYAALQQKLDVAIKRGDASMQAEMAWEKAMMATIGEDGPSCVTKAIAALKAERDALAAENSALKHAMSVILEHVSVMDAGQAGVAAMIINDALHNSETPATYAYLNAIRAEGIIMFASKQLATTSDLESTITMERLMLDAEEFAGQLRGSHKSAAERKASTE